MSLLSILIVSGLVAALAFFLAGYLLRSPTVIGGDLTKEIQKREALAGELEQLRLERTNSEAALVQAKEERRAEADARKREADLRLQAERERDTARAEAEQLSAKERTASERLRIAEDKNREAFEREEKQVEGWGAQLQAAKAEQKRQEQAVRAELEQLRAEANRCEAERARLVEERATHEAERARLVEDCARLQTALSAAQAEKQQLAEQFQRAEAASQSERDEKQSLATRLRALEEAVDHEREQGRTASEALRAAESRLADLNRLSQENAELREQQAEAAREAKWQAERGDEAKDAKVELAAAQAKLAELGRTLEENRRLRDETAELRQHQEASGDLERLTTAHKQLRLDAELMSRRLQELTQDRAELVSLRTQAAEAASLVEEVAYLRRREKDLEAQLYASGMYASREMPAMSGELMLQTPVSDMETNLHSLVGKGGPRTAVLADAQGFLIASAGESGAQEGLAAFAAVAGEMVSRARMLLPLAEVDSLRVTDKNSMVLTCHLFESAGEGLGVSTLGPGEPEAGNTARAIAELAAIVSGVAPGSDPEPDPSR